MALTQFMQILLLNSPRQQTDHSLRDQFSRTSVDVGLLIDSGIRGKLEEGGSFTSYLWQLSKGRAVTG